MIHEVLSKPRPRMELIKNGVVQCTSCRLTCVTFVYNYKKKQQYVSTQLDKYVG